MKKIFVSDSTLRNNSGVSETPLSFKQRMEIARMLDRMKVDVIELAPIENEKIDVLLARTIISFLNHAKIAIPVGFDENAIDTAANAISDASKARIQIRVPTSPVQMEYFCRRKPPVVLELIANLVKKAALTGAEVEFVAEDATRAEMPFLADAINTAICCGATVITISDVAAKMIPDEFSSFVNEVFSAVPALSNVRTGVECSNELALALANVAAVLSSEISEVKCAACADHMLSVTDFTKFVSTRGLELNIESSIRTTECRRIISQIDWILNSKKEIVKTADDVSPESGIILRAGDDIGTVTAAVAKLGYELSEEDASRVYEEFCRVAEKKTVEAAELDAIVASAALQVAPTYILKSYVINSGNVINATAQVTLEKNGEIINGVSVGDGPIDAAFIAIEQILGHHYELDDFQIKAVTEGRQALGSALVKLRAGNKIYSGNGISTDIIGASIRAYISALNKIVYEENQI